MTGIAPADQLAEVLRLIDAGKLPAPGRLADVAQKAAMYGCVDLDTLTLTDWGRRRPGHPGRRGGAVMKQIKTADFPRLLREAWR
jgi:hypothetical protein